MPPKKTTIARDDSKGDQGLQAVAALVEGGLKITLTNLTSQSLTFLPWRTPFGGMPAGNCYTVRAKKGGEAVSYRGLMVSRAAPTAASFSTLAAGASIEQTVTIDALRANYPMQAGKTYAIAFDSHFQAAFGRTPAELASPDNARAPWVS